MSTLRARHAPSPLAPVSAPHASAVIPNTPQIVKLAQKGPEAHKLMADMQAHYVAEFAPYDTPEADPVRVAFTLHQMIDREVRTLKKTPDAKRIRCTKGCGGCCHQNVLVTEAEGRYIRHLMKEQGITVDEARLARQAAHDHDPITWGQLAPEDRKCVFLAGGACRIYERRPMACRKYFVTSPPEHCDTIKNPGHRVQYIVAHQAEVVYSAALIAFESASLPRALLTFRDD